MSLLTIVVITSIHVVGAGRSLSCKDVLLGREDGATTGRSLKTLLLLGIFILLLACTAA